MYKGIDLSKTQHNINKEILDMIERLNQRIEYLEMIERGIK